MKTITVREYLYNLILDKGIDDGFDLYIKIKKWDQFATQKQILDSVQPVWWLDFLKEQ